MQIILPPEVEALVQRQLISGKYKSAIEVILAGVKLLEQQQDIYRGRLQELQQDALIGLEASQHGEVVDGATAMAQIRANIPRAACRRHIALRFKRNMTAQFRLTEPAIKDIEQFADCMARQSGFDRADRFLNKLDAKFFKIARFPNLGRQWDEILQGLRSLQMDDYLILYMMVIGRDVEIFRVVSGYRDLSVLFTDADDWF